MRLVVVLSGKGGTGKTSLSAALAVLASDCMDTVLADGDVDAANLEILLSPRRRETHSFTGGYRASIDRERCTGCGRCLEVCRFGAIVRPGGSAEPFEVDRIACEGCLSCFHHCPADAISTERSLAGSWFVSDSRCGPFFHAELSAGEENSGKLVSTIKKAAVDLCCSIGCQLLIVDGPPGIGCPVIASCAGTDLAVLVTEPGVSAIHDLRRVLGTLDHFGVGSAVVVNRSDVNPAMTREIEELCRSEGIPLLGHIPYDETVTVSMCSGRTVLEHDGAAPASVAMRAIWERLSSILRPVPDHL